MTYGVHNVIHLQITQNIVLPIVLYLSKDKVDWYNENNIHPLVLKALRPVIVEHYNQEKNASLNKKKKDSDTNQIIDLEECRLLYRFVPHKTHTKLIVTVIV
ncbi:hypothetical protein BY458DRAFT_524381 [Sporodiniella umbellata]|nr:hypothetical protein BY458DRAFT_524381 [Sporodiniella umbellata]